MLGGPTGSPSVGRLKGDPELDGWRDKRLELGRRDAPAPWRLVSEARRCCATSARGSIDGGDGARIGGVGARACGSPGEGDGALSGGEGAGAFAPSTSPAGVPRAARGASGTSADTALSGVGASSLGVRMLTRSSSERDETRASMLDSEKLRRRFCTCVRHGPASRVVLRCARRLRGGWGRRLVHGPAAVGLGGELRLDRLGEKVLARDHADELLPTVEHGHVPHADL